MLGQPLALLPCVIKDEHTEEELMVVLTNKGELSLNWGAILDFPLSARGLESKLFKIIFLHSSSPDSCISFFFSLSVNTEPPATLLLIVHLHLFPS